MAPAGGLKKRIHEIDVFLCGDGAVLQNFTVLSDDIMRKVLTWRNHEAVRKWMYTRRLIAEKDHFEFIEKLRNDEYNGYFVVSNNGQDIGVIALNDIAYDRKTANLGIYADPGRKGCGTFLMEALFCLGFDALGLNLMRAEVFEGNRNAIALYEKKGFLRESVLNSHGVVNNKWIDVYVYRIDKKKTH